METPNKPGSSNSVDELTPGTRDDAFYNFWEDRKARVAKKLKFDEKEFLEEDDKYLKVSDVMVKRYHFGKIVVRTTYVGNPGITAKGDPVITFFGMDETGEISFSAYRGNVQKVMDVAKVGAIIEVHGFYASKEKEGRFKSSRTGSDICLTLVDQSTVTQAESECIPNIPYVFVPLSEIEMKAVGEIVDVRGIIVKVRKNPFNSRDVSITDAVGNTVKVSLYKDWKDVVNEQDEIRHSCLVLRRAEVRELYVGIKYLSADWNTLVQVDPPLEEVFQLKDWWKRVTEGEED